MVKRFILLNIAIISCNYVLTHFYSIYGNYNELFDETIMSKNLASSDNIGLLSIFSVDKNTNSSSNYVGHSFISIENILPNSSFLIGKLALNSNDGITIGTWGNKSEHKGMWYNLEGYFNKKNNSYADRVSLSTYITIADLKIINEIIEKYNDKWSYFINCSSFAVDIFNSVSDILLSAGFINTPSNLKKNNNETFLFN